MERASDARTAAVKHPQVGLGGLWNGRPYPSAEQKNQNNLPAFKFRDFV